jgi:hypothetical protein
MDSLFVLAGIAMGVHLLCSIVLLVATYDTPLARELFAMPNAWLGPQPKWLGLRLLRAKYFLPWVPSPHGMRECALATRIVFSVARTSGMAFPLLVLAFLAAGFVGASR